MGRDEAWRAELREKVTGVIRFDEPADRYASMGVGGRIDALIYPENEQDLLAAVTSLRESRIPFLPVGNWTNLIVAGGGYRGALVSLAALGAIEVTEGGSGEVRLEAGAGAALSELVTLAVGQGLTGIEFCAGIPGSVGGALRMNAGAYGGEIKDICCSVRLLDPLAGFRTAARETLFFAYRNLDLPAESIIISGVFGLKRGERSKVAERVRRIMSMRKAKHPLEFRNAGSIFKNPREIPAGKLIEEAGLKGMRIGDAQVSEKHANFIINRGEATADQVLRLIALVQKRVSETTGFALETEVKIIGGETGNAAGHMRVQR